MHVLSSSQVTDEVVCFQTMLFIFIKEKFLLHAHLVQRWTTTFVVVTYRSLSLVLVLLLRDPRKLSHTFSVDISFLEHLLRVLLPRLHVFVL